MQEGSTDIIYHIWRAVWPLQP